MLFNIHEMLQSDGERARLRETLKYMFIEIIDKDSNDNPERNIDRMMEALAKKYLKLEGAQNIQEGNYIDQLIAYNQSQQDDKGKEKAVDFDRANEAYLEAVMDVYDSIEERHFPMTHKAYQKSKIDLFERVMLDANPSIGLAKEAGKVLKGMDLGCGSGWAKQLMGERMHAEFTGVDLEHEDKTKWAGNEGKAHVGEEDVVHYDGVHLIEAMEGDTKGYTQLYDMITYNYVLHHYPDRDAQVKGLQKAAALLKEGGVMMFSEHATLLSDPQIELQHVFFDLKKVPTEKRKHGDEANYVKEYEQEKGKAAYFSRELLFAVAKECGLKPIVVRPRLGGMDHKEEYDASQAVMIGFVRTEKTLTPGELRRFVPKSQSELNVKALEAEDVSKLDVKWVSGDSDVAGKKVPLSIQTASFFEASSDLRKSADGRLERSDFFAEQRKEKAGAAGASGSSSANKDEANPDKPKGP